jgi:hypothetical protein
MLPMPGLSRPRLSRALPGRLLAALVDAVPVSALELDPKTALEARLFE